MYEKRRLIDGFLDDDLQLEVKKIRKENEAIYKIIKKINSLFYITIRKFERNNPSNVDLYIFVTFSQIHTSFQSYIILLERGLYEDSQIVLRSIYDKIFHCLYIIDNNNNFEILVQDNLNQQIKVCEYVLNNKLYEFLSEEKLNSKLKELKKFRKLNDKGKLISMPNNCDICEKCNIKDSYVHYKLLSGYTHNSLTVIDSRLIKDKTGLFIDQNIRHGNFNEEIVKGACCLQYVIDSLCKYLNLKEIKFEFDSLIKDLLKLAENNMI